jgi:hypothetical protein
MKKVFVSYASGSDADIAIAEWVLTQARNVGYEVFCQLTDDTVPSDLHESLEERIKASEIFLAVWSEQYLKGPHCEYERNLLLAIDPNVKSKVLLGFRIDNVEIPARFRRGPYIDVRQYGLEKAKEKLLRTLTLLTHGSSATSDAQPKLQKEGHREPAEEVRTRPHGLPSVEDRSLFTPTRSPPAGQIASQFQEFLEALSRFSSVEHPESTVDISTLPVREPKFMVFEKDKHHVMAILDINARVRPSNLRKTNEVESIGHLASRELLPGLGFDTSFVHPMFRDPHNVFRTIFIDGNLFFQSVYFPHSLIKLPYWKDGREQKIDVSISAFIGAMRKLHGTDKIVFASITRNGWPDRILIEGFQRSHMLVRFAPTPTNTLHFGNVRTALVSYLMHRAKWEQSKFFLRIDDTNKTTHPDNWSNQIRQDLKWLGFLLNPEWEFSQTDPLRQHVYKAFFSLLQTFGYTEQLMNGEIWLNWKRSELQFVHWLDWEAGPMIEHDVPKTVTVKTKKSRKARVTLTDPTGSQIANLALTTPAGDFLYKFCGTVDDLLCTSHAVRDIRQIHLTRRQSLIRHAILLAWQEAVRTGVAEEERQLILAERERLVGVESSDGLVSMPDSLLPFLSPPVFIHTPVVVDDDGEPLKKRELRHKPYSILEGRDNGTFLPETIVSYLVYTILSANSEKQGGSRSKELAVLAAELGVEAFLDAIAIDFSSDWLHRRKDQIKVSLDAIEHQERLVLTRISYFHLRQHIRAFFQSNYDTEPPDELIERIYGTRRHFDKWTQIICVIRDPGRRPCTKPIADALLSVARANAADEVIMSPKAFNAELAAKLPDSSKIADVCRLIRNSLMGVAKGPSIPALIYVLGLHETERRIRPS